MAITRAQAVTALLGFLALEGGPASAQTGVAPAPAAQKPAETPSDVILRALRKNPATAPYAFGVKPKDGRFVLTGRVSTKFVHDVAVNLATAVTTRLDDRLVIDSTAPRFVASSPPPGAAPPSMYVYPPPLFGRLDDPFYGFEPPLITYPPGWGAVAARRGDPYAAPVLDPNSPIGADPGPARRGGGPPPPPQPISRTDEGRSVEMTLDPRGVAVLRGTVPTESARQGIARKAATLEGVKEVVNRLEVQADPADEAATIRPQDVPPPLPMPAGALDGPAQKGAAPKAIVADAAAAASPVERRVAQAIERRPGMNGSAVKVDVRDGVATLTGKVPTALEAMMAFRSAQQTVGIREIIDRLEFAVPDGQKPNPLIAKARPEDVEPYLEAQIRRQMNDRAHIDRVRVTGDRLEVKGTVPRAEDRAGAEAVLRSMPLLRGFTISATLAPE
jgi:BON domain